MGEYTESFTVDADARVVEEVCIRCFIGFGFKFLGKRENVIVFEKGLLKKNIFTFSFDEAYKRVSVFLVGDPEIPVTTVSMNFSLPYLKLKKDDISAIKSMIRAFKERVIISSGYEAIRRR